MQPLLQWKGNKYYKLCVCSLRYSAYKAHAPYCHLWPVWLYHIFSTLSKKRRHNLRKNVIEHKMCILIFSTTWSETFLILSRTERDMITNKYIGLHVKYPLFLSDFNEAWIFSTDFLKILKYQISWKSAQWKPIRSMRTDRHGEALRHFANAPENWVSGPNAAALNPLNCHVSPELHIRFSSYRAVNTLRVGYYTQSPNVV